MVSLPVMTLVGQKDVGGCLGCMTAMAIESLRLAPGAPFSINGLRDRPGNGWWGVVSVMNVLNMTGSNISIYCGCLVKGVDKGGLGELKPPPPKF